MVAVERLGEEGHRELHRHPGFDDLSGNAPRLDRWRAFG